MTKKEETYDTENIDDGVEADVYHNLRWHLLLWPRVMPDWSPFFTLAVPRTFLYPYYDDSCNQKQKQNENEKLGQIRRASKARDIYIYQVSNPVQFQFPRHITQLPAACGRVSKPVQSSSSCCSAENSATLFIFKIFKHEMVHMNPAG